MMKFCFGVFQIQRVNNFASLMLYFCHDSNSNFNVYKRENLDFRDCATNLSSDAEDFLSRILPTTYIKSSQLYLDGKKQPFFLSLSLLLLKSIVSASLTEEVKLLACRKWTHASNNLYFNKTS